MQATLPSIHERVCASGTVYEHAVPCTIVLVLDGLKILEHVSVSLGNVLS